MSDPIDELEQIASAGPSAFSSGVAAAVADLVVAVTNGDPRAFDTYKARAKELIDQLKEDNRK